MPSLEVNLSREFKLTRDYKGVTLTEDTGMNYVDVYFADGTSKTLGYIKRGDGETSWSPCHKAPQAVYDAIQEQINLQRGGNIAAPFNLGSAIDVEEDQ